jgi:leucyl aminopeptidase (aminopeptidase T)
MKETDRVHIKGPGTDLRFSIRGIGAMPCGGLRNIPDGEVFSCPVKDSVEGHVQYNAPTVYLGQSFDNIRLAFKRGRIVEATSNNTKRLNEILDSDDGARYIGEFALGFNPHILDPMARLTTAWATATSRRCTGTWSVSSAPNTAAVKSGSTTSLSGRTASSCRNRCTS